jgi:hypothetical protein
MEDNAKLLESLLEKAIDYGKTSIELGKLKALDKSSDIVSTVIPRSVVIALLIIFMFFLNFGVSFWLGDLLGQIYYGFFVVAAFYGLIAFILHFFFHKRFKKIVSNYFIKKVLK